MELSPAVKVNAEVAVKVLLMLGRFSLAIGCVLAFTAALHPSTRAGIRSALLQDYRTVLSSVQSQLTGGGSSYLIAKIETRDKLSLEIYKNDLTNGPYLVEKIDIPDSTDGYFSFSGHASSLALDDIDGDGVLEILAPSFDRDLVGHLNIFRFNPSSQGIERVVR